MYYSSEITQIKALEESPNRGEGQGGSKEKVKWPWETKDTKIGKSYWKGKVVQSEESVGRREPKEERDVAERNREYGNMWLRTNKVKVE